MFRKVHELEILNHVSKYSSSTKKKKKPLIIFLEMLCP